MAANKTAPAKNSCTQDGGDLQSPIPRRAGFVSLPNVGVSIAPTQSDPAPPRAAASWFPVFDLSNVPSGAIAKDSCSVRCAFSSPLKLINEFKQINLYLRKKQK
jgi:hypothetical protein